MQRKTFVKKFLEFSRSRNIFVHCDVEDILDYWSKSRSQFHHLEYMLKIYERSLPSHVQGLGQWNSRVRAKKIGTNALVDLLSNISDYPVLETACAELTS